MANLSVRPLKLKHKVNGSNIHALQAKSCSMVFRSILLWASEHAIWIVIATSLVHYVKNKVYGDLPLWQHDAPCHSLLCKATLIRQLSSLPILTHTYIEFPSGQSTTSKRALVLSLFWACHVCVSEWIRCPPKSAWFGKHAKSLDVRSNHRCMHWSVPWSSNVDMSQEAHPFNCTKVLAKPKSVRSLQWVCGLCNECCRDIKNRPQRHTVPCAGLQQLIPHLLCRVAFWKVLIGLFIKRQFESNLLFQPVQVTLRAWNSCR